MTGRQRLNLDDLSASDIPKDWKAAATHEIRDALRGRDVHVSDFWLAAVIRALAPRIRDQILADAEPDPCDAYVDDNERNYCDQPKGHAGSHQSTLVWD